MQSAKLKIDPTFGLSGKLFTFDHCRRKLCLLCAEM